MTKTHPYITVEKDHSGYTIVRVGENDSDRDIKKKSDGLRAALASGIRAAEAEGIAFRYGDLRVHQAHLTIQRTSSGWLVKTVESGGLSHMATERMHPYGHLETAVDTCYKQHKRSRMPISIELTARPPSAST